MEDIVQLIASLGGLHDARITDLRWTPSARSLEIEVDDLYSNSLGLPDYQGRTKAKFVFSDVSKADVQVNLAGTYIYGWTFTEGVTYSCELHFGPGGRIAIDCGGIECVKLGQV